MHTAESEMAISTEKRLKKHVVIEFLMAEGCSLVNINQSMTPVYGDACVEVSSGRRWARTIEGNNPAMMNLHDHAHAHSGRWITATHTWHQVHQEELINNHRCVRWKDIAIVFGILNE